MRCPLCGAWVDGGHACTYQDADTGRRLLRRDEEARIATLRAIAEEAIEMLVVAGFPANATRLRERLEEVTL